MSQQMSGDWSVRDIPKAKMSKKCPYSMNPVGICLHNTANSAAASGEISYMHNNNSSTSYHFAIDESQAIQGLPLNRNAWHAGDGGSGSGNRKHIGIEIARSTDNTPGRFAQAEKRAAAVCAKLLGQYGWGVNNIKAHRDFSGKNCPHRTSMSAFRNLVTQALGGKLPGPNPQTTPQPAPPGSKATVTCNVLNVRSGPGTGHSVLGTLKKGASVSVKGETNGWLNITYNGKNAYISKQYTKTGGSSTPAPAPTTTATVTCDVLNVRKGPGTGNAVLGTLKKGASVTVKGESNGWLNITYNGKNAYISKQYTTAKSSGANPAPVKKTARVTCSVLNVRSGPGTGYGKIGTLSNGQTVTVSGDSGGWLNINYNGRSGFISKQYTSLGSGGGGSTGGGGGAVGANGVPLYAQGDPAWGNRRLGTGLTIRSHGCAMTSTAMAISKIGGRKINPGQLDAYLDSNRGYAGNNLYWGVAARMIGRSAQSLGVNKGTIDRELNAGKPVVISVKSQGHWVCVAGRNSNGSYIIHDPAGGRVRSASWNGSRVVVSGYSTGNQLRTF